MNLLLVPSFCFARSSLEKRKPLSPSARRAGWVGCNILLSGIPQDAKIPIVHQSMKLSRQTVRNRFEHVKALSAIDVEVRGWTLDVLNLARSLRRNRFTLTDVYGFEATLAKMYPMNKHIRPKIRQQIQVLRDIGIVRFVSRGTYEFTR